MKTLVSLEIMRNGDTRPADVKAVTEAGFVYTFHIAPELSDRQAERLVGRLVSREEKTTRRKKVTA